METADVVKQFGLDPEQVGLRHRGWRIVTTLYGEEPDGVQVGDLCVEARDGGYNEPDMSVGRYPNYKGTATDSGDGTYRYYYFAPLAPTESPR